MYVTDIKELLEKLGDGFRANIIPHNLLVRYKGVELFKIPSGKILEITEEDLILRLVEGIENLKIIITELEEIIQ